MRKDGCVLRVNIAQVVFLCNVVSRHIQTTLARGYSYSVPGPSQTTLHRAFYLCNGCLKSIKSILKIIFSRLMWSGVSKTTLHKIFSV